MNKTLVLYVFHDFTPNVDNFLKRGLVADHQKHFILIANGCDIKKIHDRVKDLSNVLILQRPNIGIDFGGWNDALFLPASAIHKKIVTPSKNVEKGQFMYQIANKFVFINSTVTGPYLPTYCNNDWIDCFTSKLDGQVKITGISANFLSQAGTPKGEPRREHFVKSVKELINDTYHFMPENGIHIQSMAFSLDTVGLEVLIKYGLFGLQKKPVIIKDHVIALCEIGMSSIILNEGYSLFSFCVGQGKISPGDTRKGGDIWGIWNKETNFITSHNPFEFMFIKTRAGIKTDDKARYDKD